jgi:hypothetical protein
MEHNERIAYYDCDTNYLLKINKAGRMLVEGDHKPIPMNVWPIVLKNAYKKSTMSSSKDPSDLNYLLCHSHVLYGYHHRHCHSLTTLNTQQQQDVVGRRQDIVATINNNNLLKRKRKRSRK